MADGKDSKQEIIVPVSEQAPIVDGLQTYQHEDRHWLHLVLYLITALIFAFFLVLAGRGVYHHFHHRNTRPTSPAPAQKAAPSTPAVQAPASNQSTNNNSTNNTNTGTKTTPTTANLPGTGPANTIAIFASVSLVVAGLHYAVTARKVS